MDRWFPYGEGQTRAIAPRMVYLICSHNLAISAWQGITRALILGSPLHIKVSSHQSIEIRDFIQSLPSNLRALVTLTPRHSALRMRSAEIIVAFGRDTTLQAIRQQLLPHQRFLGYGSQVSLLWLGKLRASPRDLLEKVADDICAYDQLGCLSPQAIYLAKGSNVRSFCSLLAKTLASRPHPSRSSMQNLQIASLVRTTRATFPNTHTWTPKNGGTDWTIFQHRSPRFQPSCGYRTIHVHEVSIPLLPIALNSVRGQISTVGTTQTLDPVAEKHFLDLGVKRFCPVGRCQRPSPYWHHDGRPQLADMVRWADFELGD